MQSILLVGVGGFLGAVARFGMARFVYSLGSVPFPLATLVINVSGSFALGFVYRYFENHPYLSSIVLFAGIGFMGAFTTFSTFSIETLNLVRKGAIAMATLNVMLSVGLCLLGVYGGDSLGRAIGK